MAIKSLLLSLTLTVLVGYTFTAGLTSPNSLVKKLPDWASYLLIAAVFVFYLLATWWAIKGFGASKLTALVSLGFCVFGLGLYAWGYTMAMGKGKASPGQYDYTLDHLAPEEKVALAQMAQNAGLGLSAAVFTEHWHVAEAVQGFGVCLQKGHVTALNFSGKKVPDLGLLHQFPQLSDLYLNHCGLSDMRALRHEKLDRLELADNQISDLTTLSGCPNLRWLVLRNNQLPSDQGIEAFTKLVSKDLSGNPGQR